MLGSQPEFSQEGRGHRRELCAVTSPLLGRGIHSALERGTRSLQYESIPRA